MLMCSNLRLDSCGETDFVLLGELALVRELGGFAMHESQVFLLL